SEFKDAAKLGSSKVNVTVDVRPDLLGAAHIGSQIDTAPKRDGESFGYVVGHSLLGNREALRRAIVLNEVLGKPVALRD
ncbi:MAG: hypothetical protein ABI837_09285, partial [Acidobacteriota bacterium]